MTALLAEVFSASGPLAAAVPGYRPRSQQLELAERIAAAMAANAVLVAEAGTGTGKTYAYLVPALLSGGKVIVSTGTKNLQDQLFARDIPTIRKALGLPVRVALLKGRANYLCHHHLARSLADGRFLTREDAAWAQRIARFAQQTRSGDKAECVDVPENATVWPMVTSTRDNCLGQDCPQHKECFVLAARREALAADLVVVNHHLFFADVMLRDEGTAELLPACNTVVFDEAHQLPEVASLFFGDSVSTAQLLELGRDAQSEALTAARDCLDLPRLSVRLEKDVRDLRLTLPVEPARHALPQLAARPRFAEALATTIAAVEALAALLETQAQRSEGLDNCWRRAGSLLQRLQAWQAGTNDDFVRWAETYTHALQLNATPLAIAGIMQKQMSGHPRAWIFTSATLAVQNDFGHYCAEMGLVDASSARWESPFDYPRQALLYVPRNLPEPNAPDHAEAVVGAAWPVLRESGGRAFFLCTSLRAMRRVHELLADRLARDGLELPLLLQGELGKNELLERFRRLGNAILIGSQSFWEGVDVRGEALSLVVIDKLPFAPPDDPVLSARLDRLRSEGRNGFLEYQLPRTVINVKQGAGRLIRDESDRGVLMICDPRLIAKTYGKRIWRSLPPMRRTRELADAVAFFRPAAGASGA
ncbi:ATP-dependent DNA helicase [Accumulibacter sp.]|jgi:ATP-dependent DNA helicase DinG|uniref:ATP-dependent DNA helicase n=1 Tax=Accumulibacter sp. TaxID=2053492 RepID=UPI0025E60B9B|nr:ATP-dependent DNA helicase [Accumulibacter sp.]MCM8610489.1 ATP-dependent DNA helicase [Accumulibacter sp.]MCM8634389.1 ATP-dependent DNA helicase [Accumulibacter sp.]MCM8641582.1 ATP-dependent DNA helicase [Accumulibacter sp.]